MLPFLTQPTDKPTASVEMHEAEFLLRYVTSDCMRWTPALEDCARLLIALDARGIAMDPAIPSIFHRFPFLLRGIDLWSHIFAPTCALQQKIIVATAIAECTPTSAVCLLPQQRSTFSLLLLGSRLACRSFAVGMLLFIVPIFVRFYGRTCGIR